MPVLSIILPVFNREKYIRDTLKSLIKQSFTDFELIIIDNASTDNTVSIISEFNDNRICLIKNTENMGIPYARNQGLKIAEGNFIAPFDSDDIALPDKFKKQIDFLQNNPDYGMIGTWVKLIDENGNSINKHWKLKSKPDRIPAKLLFRNFFAQPSVVIRKEAIPLQGYHTSFNIGEDYMMWIEISDKYKTYNIPEYLVLCRIHNSNSSSENKQKLLEYDYKIYLFLFNRLQIEINENNFKLIENIKNNLKISSINLLIEIELFLLTILKKNLSLNIYNHKQLKKEVLNRWFKVCFKARSININFLKVFIKSPLTRLCVNL